MSQKDYNANGHLTIEELSPGLLQDIKDIAVEVAGIEEAETTSFDASKYQEGHVMHMVDDVQEAIDKLTDLVDNTASHEENGLMSVEDKIKLDSLPTRIIAGNNIELEQQDGVLKINAVAVKVDFRSIDLTDDYEMIRINVNPPYMITFLNNDNQKMLKAVKGE